MSETKWDVAPAAGLDPQLGLLLAMLDDGTNEWREELCEDGEITPEAIIWQPFKEGHSIGAIILHIADVEAFWIEEVAAQRPRDEEEFKRLLSEETQQMSVKWPVPPQKPLSWYWEQHDAIRKRTHKTVRELADPLITRFRPNRNSYYTLRWILHHVITHEAYHGGQAVLCALQYSRKM